MTPSPRRLSRIPASLGSLLLLAAAACGDATECGPGTRSEDGTCVAVCQSGTEPDPASGACVPVCQPGTHRDTATGLCLPESAQCTSGSVWDVESARCIEVTALCASGTTWVASEQRCVPDAELKVPDQFEGEAFNDFVPGGMSCETFSLPDVGATYSIGGNVDVPDEEWVTHDTDCWEFEVTTPVLLRLKADGLGGAAAGFRIYSIDVYEPDRLALGSTSLHVTRDVFLPSPGRYALVAGDALNVVLEAGIPRGGAGMGYFIEIAQLELPEPTPAAPDENGIVARGVWRHDLPAEGTNLGFYTVPVEALDMFHLGLHADDTRVHQILAGVSTDGRGFAADYLHQPFATAYGQGGDVLLVADYALWLSTEDVPYTLTMEPKTLTMVEPGTHTETVSQPAWSMGSPAVSAYFGFMAKAGDVVSLPIHTETGFTCFNVWNEGFDRFAGDGGCYIVSTPEYDHEIRFVPDRDGLYVLSVLDWSQARIEGGTLLAIAEHDYTFEFSLRHQTPVGPENLDAPWSATFSVDAQDYERFISLRPEAGSLYRIELAGQDGFVPVPRFYSQTDGWLFLMPDYFWVDGHRFVYRSIDGHEFRMGVSGADRDAGTFTVGIEPFQPVELPASELPATHTIVVPAMDPNAWHELVVGEPGRVTLTVTPPADVDLAVLFGQPDLSAPGEYELPRLLHDEAGEGEPERWQGELPAGRHHFRLLTPGLEPPPADWTVDAEVEFDPIQTESERNDTAAEADPVAFPGSIAGKEDHLYDEDWFTFELDSPTTIEVHTRVMALSARSVPEAWIFDAEGRLLARTNGGELAGLSLPAGTFRTVVYASGEYVLELSESSL